MQAEFFMWHWNTFPEERGMLCGNINNSQNAIKGQINRALGVVKGRADMEYNHMSTTIFIEFKTPDGYQSTDQKKFQALVESQGFRYVIPRSVEEGKELIYELQKTRSIYEKWRRQA